MKCGSRNRSSESLPLRPFYEAAAVMLFYIVVNPERNCRGSFRRDFTGGKNTSLDNLIIRCSGEHFLKYNSENMKMVYEVCFDLQLVPSVIWEYIRENANEDVILSFVGNVILNLL